MKKHIITPGRTPRKISISELTNKISNISSSNTLIRFKTSIEDFFIYWGTMVELEGNKMYAVISPSLSCECEISCKPLKEFVIREWVMEMGVNDKDFDGKHVFLVP